MIMMIMKLEDIYNWRKKSKVNNLIGTKSESVEWKQDRWIDNDGDNNGNNDDDDDCDDNDDDEYNTA